MNERPFTPPRLRLLRNTAAATALILVLAGCESVRGWVPPLIQPYRPDVQQGNVVTREMAEQLREGMSREQVRFLLGTPMLSSPFHADALGLRVLPQAWQGQ
jgi:outer membrane protein assembly factor BamE